MALLDYTYVLTGGALPVVYGGARVVFGSPSLSADVGERLVPFTPEEYREALAALLPTGPAWPREPQAGLMALLQGFAQELARLDQRAAVLIDEAFAPSTSELLPDWERVFGLPDPCVTVAQTVAERRQALLGRMSAIGRQSPAFFIDLASRLGYSVTVEEFHSASEATAAGISFTGSQWAHIWRVHVAASVGVRFFAVGSGAVGEPLSSWGNEALECQFNRFKPAHTQVLFAYAP